MALVEHWHQWLMVLQGCFLKSKQWKALQKHWHHSMNVHMTLRLFVTTRLNLICRVFIVEFSSLLKPKWAKKDQRSCVHLQATWYNNKKRGEMSDYPLREEEFRLFYCAFN